MLAKYELVSSLGAGGYGNVFLALEPESHRTVALKVLDTKRFSEQEMKFLKNEITAMQALSHKHIIKLDSVQRDCHRTVLVMEYAANGDLREYINFSGFSSDQDARLIIRPLCEALRYTHSKGFIHRDVKLDNILIDEQNNIKLADWGLSCRFDPTKTLNEFVGSLHYAAPELVSGKPYVGPEIDCWAVGVVLFAIVAGSLPFVEDPDISDKQRAQKKLVRRIKRAKYFVPYGVSQSCQLLIRGLLEVDPKKRLTIDEVLNHPWTRASGSTTLAFDRSFEAEVALYEL